MPKTVVAPLDPAHLVHLAPLDAGRRRIASRGGRERLGAFARALAACLAIATLAAIAAPEVRAQGSRKDDIVFGPTGHPVAGASVLVCQPSATGTPCSPLATIYTSAAMTTTAPNPITADGIGNYHFYAPAGRYVIQISGPTLTGTTTYPDVILSPDVSSTGSGNNISAFGLTLGGNLSVAGNTAISGTLTAGTFSVGTLNPTSIAATGNGCFGGPSPTIDVTCPPYNAKGDGSTDDTAAIQAAITAACNAGSLSAEHATIYFPFAKNGTYKVSQPQTPSTSPVFTSLCYLHFVGEGSVALGAQFIRAPTVVIQVATGASPNAAPVFSLVGAGGNNSTFENLNINGYNQAIADSTSDVTLKNTCLTATATGETDNAPLALYNVIWFWMYGGCLQPADGSHPSMIMAATGGYEVGPILLRDVHILGGGILYSQRTNAAGAPSGGWTFDDVQMEGSNQDFLHIQNDTGNPGNTAMPTIGPITMNYLLDADAMNNTNAVVSFNSSNSILMGLFLNHVSAGNASGPAIKMTAGTLKDAKLFSCPRNAGVCSQAVVDGSGNSVGGITASNSNGFDYTVDTANSGRLETTKEIFSSDLNPGSALRLFPAGGNFSTLQTDPALGLLLGPGNAGYSGQVAQNAEETVGIGVAKYLPPTSVAGSPTTGGSLASGTYYYWLMSCSDVTCATHSTVAAATSAIVVSGSNHTVNLTWTLPAATPATPGGYTVIRSTSPVFQYNASLANVWVAGATTASYSDAGFSGCCWSIPPTATMIEAHRFTASSLGVNTTSPQFNLDVNGSASVNSLNAVQKAERFAGADAGVQINACLAAAAATSSGLCDARGLTGTLTATHHISIPAGVTLLWGAAELTISDSGTNDAIELAGDGSSLMGYQESGLGTVPRPDTSGYIACGIAGCTTVKNPNQGTRNVDWVHISGMYLLANGASSKVLDLTSVGHSRVQDNQITVGTGGGSYGIYGDTSTGDFDSTNDIVQHNQINLESSNDTCLRLAGIFNINVIEINSCYFASANTGQEGFVYAKDSNGNYPNNSLLYGNDAEQGGASISFGVIGYDVQGAQDITISNNRCEHLYACMRLPSDGSAVGVHMLDNYLSTSNQVQLLPNEPQTSQYAIDNNSHNWLPSQHFGLSDLGGPNLLGNAGFEGWSGSTALYYWGGVTGTSINQAGSGIYAQQASASAPADATTQGSYNVAIGDNATAGLGINSACVQVDATMEYTLALRVASTSTGVKFRPGFRFYSDPNCTEANRITSVSTNARVLSPANYAGQAALLGPTGPNWQSTNASLTYNNGITCNCNVTGADWNVGTASSWTPTRNFAVTFRVPDAYSSAATVAQSMRVFVLENTAANPNKIYVDDVVLSQGPASPNVPVAKALADSGSPTEYGNLTVAGALTVGTLPATLTSGTPAAGNCAAFASSPTTNVQDGGAPCPALLTKFSMGSVVGGQAASANNAIDVSVIYLPNIQFSHLTVDVSTTDASTSDFYSWAITDLSGNVKCSITAVNVTAGGASDQACTQGTVTLANGAYLFAFTGNATTGKIAYSGTAPLPLSSAVSSSTSASGAITFPIAVPSAGATYSGYGLPAIILH